MKELSLADALTQLGIQKSNLGVSTGSQWLSSKGPAIVSISPVDGKKIGSVKSTDEASFRKVVAVAE
ncbi:MAG: aldehyde dehydrogenase family protein, partial [Cyclobacteriaceae bacterium]